MVGSSLYVAESEAVLETIRKTQMKEGGESSNPRG
jgi:hypothetical protein